MKKPKVLVLRTAGTNCDKETQFAFQFAGAEADLTHINEIFAQKIDLSNYQILALPGGFSYGDDLGAGKILANELRFKLQKELENFLKNGKLIIGICNGFQILVKAGLLPGYNRFSQEASLILNDSAKFEDRWVYLRRTKDEGRETRCIWAQNLPEVIYLPVAHGEGKFVVKDQTILEKLKSNNQIIFQYCNKSGESSGYPERIALPVPIKEGAYPDNPNGSIENIAGICDETGRVLGLMPHPERHIFFHQHPHWTRLPKKEYGDGLLIFKNGVEYAKRKL